MAAVATAAAPKTLSQQLRAAESEFIGCAEDLSPELVQENQQSKEVFKQVEDYFVEHFDFYVKASKALTGFSQDVLEKYKGYQDKVVALPTNPKTLTKDDERNRTTYNDYLDTCSSLNRFVLVLQQKANSLAPILLDPAEINPLRIKHIKAIATQADLRMQIAREMHGRAVILSQTMNANLKEASTRVGDYGLLVKNGGKPIGGLSYSVSSYDLSRPEPVKKEEGKAREKQTQPTGKQQYVVVAAGKPPSNKPEPAKK